MDKEEKKLLEEILRNLEEIGTILEIVFKDKLEEEFGV